MAPPARSARRRRRSSRGRSAGRTRSVVGLARHDRRREPRDGAVRGLPFPDAESARARRQRARAAARIARVMPAALLGVVAYPFGLDRPIWQLMGFAVAQVLDVSAWVSGFEGSTLVVPALGAGALSAFCLTLLLITSSGILAALARRDPGRGRLRSRRGPGAIRRLCRSRGRGRGGARPGGPARPRRPTLGLRRGAMAARRRRLRARPTTRPCATAPGAIPSAASCRGPTDAASPMFRIRAPSRRIAAAPRWSSRAWRRRRPATRAWFSTERSFKPMAPRRCACATAAPRCDRPGVTAHHRPGRDRLISRTRGSRRAANRRRRLRCARRNPASTCRTPSTRPTQRVADRSVATAGAVTADADDPPSR